MRTCIKCGETKKDTGYYKRKDRESGYFNTCKECYSAWRKNRYKNQKEYVKIYEANRKNLPSRRFQKMKARAKKKKISLNLNLADYEKIISKPCYYCNNILGNPVMGGIGLDRLNPTLGYEVSNVVSCCAFCNTVKMDNLTEKEMIEVAKLLIKLRNL